MDIRDANGAVVGAINVASGFHGAVALIVSFPVGYQSLRPKSHLAVEL